MKDIKTTIAGLLVGVPVIATAIVNAYNSGAFKGENGTQIALGVAAIVFGILSADAKAAA